MRKNLNNAPAQEVGFTFFDEIIWGKGGANARQLRLLHLVFESYRMNKGLKSLVLQRGKN